MMKILIRAADLRDTVHRVLVPRPFVIAERTDLERVTNLLAEIILGAVAVAIIAAVIDG
jgi:hypothetical protein